MASRIKIDLPYHNPINIIKNFNKNELYPHNEFKSSGFQKKYENQTSENFIKETIEDQFNRESKSPKGKKKNAFATEFTNLKYGIDKTKDKEEGNKKARLYDDLEISDCQSENLNISESINSSFNMSISNEYKIEDKKEFDFEDNVNKKYVNEHPNSK